MMHFLVDDSNNKNHGQHGQSYIKQGQVYCTQGKSSPDTVKGNDYFLADFKDIIREAVRKTIPYPDNCIKNC